MQAHMRPWRHTDAGTHERPWRHTDAPMDTHGHTWHTDAHMASARTHLLGCLQWAGWWPRWGHTGRWSAHTRAHRRWTATPTGEGVRSAWPVDLHPSALGEGYASQTSWYITRLAFALLHGASGFLPAMAAHSIPPPHERAADSSTPAHPLFASLPLHSPPCTPCTHHERIAGHVIQRRCRSRRHEHRIAQQLRHPCPPSGLL